MSESRIMHDLSRAWGDLLRKEIMKPLEHGARLLSMITDWLEVNPVPTTWDGLVQSLEKDLVLLLAVVVLSEGALRICILLSRTLFHVIMYTLQIFHNRIFAFIVPYIQYILHPYVAVVV